MPAFVDVLAGLKRDGCSILVTGEVPAAVTAQAARKLLGSPAEDRRRALVVTDPAASGPDTLLPGSVRPDDHDVHVVDRRDFHRESPVATDGDVERPLDLDLATVLRDTVRTLAPSDGYGASQLRTGVVSLLPLLDEYGVDPVRRDLRDAGAAVRGVDGMAHFHLPTDEEGLAEELVPAVDARIELRRRVGHVPEQRWSVPSRDFSTQWLEL